MQYGNTKQTLIRSPLLAQAPLWNYKIFPPLHESSRKIKLEVSSTMKIVYPYANFNRISYIHTGNHFEMNYNWNDITGNLESRTDITQDLTECFTYEKEILADGTIKEYHYISGPAGLIAIYLKVNSTGTLYYVATDHLGSIVQVLASNGTLLEEANYDPWGRYRKPDSWVYPKQVYSTSQQLTLTFRGYTGHEMLPEFGLINMNGRMYDPALGRMLSPDNFVQDPYNPQSYNRFTYALNNPLKYTDPSGDFITGLPFIDATLWTIAGAVAPNVGILMDPVSNASNSYIVGFATEDGSFTDRAEEGNRRLTNSIALGDAMLYTDRDAPWYEQAGQLKGKFSSWEFPHTMIGYGAANFHNIIGDVESVNNFHGATQVEMTDDWFGSNFTFAYTIGPYLMGDFDITELEYDAAGNLTWQSSVLVHEYGHYLQGRSWGTIGYIPGAINSVRHNWANTDPQAWSERDADRRAIEYMNSHGENTTGYAWGPAAGGLPRETVNLWWMTFLFYGGAVVY